MATTAKGFPYPLGTDRVMDGDDAIHSLADAVGNFHGARLWSTTVTVNVSSASSANAGVTFPVGLFTTAPVCVGSSATNSTVWFAIVTGATATGCTASAVQRDGAAASGTVAVSVIAQQFS